MTDIVGPQSLVTMFHAVPGMVVVLVLLLLVLLLVLLLLVLLLVLLLRLAGRQALLRGKIGRTDGLVVAGTPDHICYSANLKARGANAMITTYVSAFAA
jgi:hypothetical protein